MSIKYSFSRLNSFDACPRQYKFAYIEKAQVEKPVSVEAFMGASVHHALEKLYRFKDSGKIMPVEDFIKVYLERWEGPDKASIKVTVEGMAVEDYIANGEKALRKYYEKYHPFDEGEIIGLEHFINFPLDPEGRYAITGKIDKIVKRPDGVLEIVDYKTSRSLITQPILDDDTQMGLYQAGVNTQWPQFDQVELKQVFLVKDIEMKTVMPPDKIDEIKYRAFQKILEIERAIKEDDFKPKESKLCDYCVFFSLCPAKRHFLALKDDSEEPFDAAAGKELAERYLQLIQQRKTIDSELDALKDDILKYCEAADLAKLEGDSGYIKLTIYKGEEFPSATKDPAAFLEMSELARRAKLDECFKLDVNALYKELYLKEKLPPDLRERLSKFVIEKKQSRFTTSYKIKDGED